MLDLENFGKIFSPLIAGSIGKAFLNLDNVKTREKCSELYQISEPTQAAPETFN